jgi:class 3 adenylate cyclase
MSEFQNRTLICSVLFIDIVEYSRKSVVEQGNLKDLFNRLLSEALRDVALNDRIILDTGDGAAISFIGDPEDALFVATGLRDVIASRVAAGGPQLLTRTGINLGPVRLVKDINGQPNIIGDGINVAQRVMTFAKPGQVLVSRSYYEVVSRLSDESSRLFSYEGARTDKHIREHEVYAVGAIPGVRKRFDAGEAGAWQGGIAPAGGLVTVKRNLSEAAERLVSKPRLATALAVIGILGVAVGARAYRAEEPTRVAPARPTPLVLHTPAGPVAPLPPIRGLPPERDHSAAQTVTVVDLVPPERKLRGRQDAGGRELPQRDELALRESPRAAVDPAAPAAPAIVSIAVAPWGEIHVDGRLHGVSPPLQDLELQPGRHRIEIRNGGFAPHVEVITARSGERLRIKHKFNH